MADTPRITVPIEGLVPKAEPVSDPYKFAAWVEEMTAKHGNPNGTDYEQGQNDMGVRIASRLRSIAAHPEAPKVEQEAVAWRYRPKKEPVRWAEWTTRRWEVRDHLIEECAYPSHPAPASDELLEADLAYLREWLEAERDGRAKYTGTIQREAAFEQAVRIVSKLAKHKGPQS